MGVEPFLISSSVIGVLAQRLARTICLHCKEAYTPRVDAVQRLGLKPEQDEEIVFYRGRGCDRCKGAGYKGRLGIFELMPISEPIREIILKGGSAAQIRDQAIAEGMKTLADDGILKALEGVTTIDELLRVVYVEEQRKREEGRGKKWRCPRRRGSGFPRFLLPSSLFPGGCRRVRRLPL